MIVIEPHYLGSLEYYALLQTTNEVLLEVNDPFPKQTYRNRAYFLTSNKTQTLIVPVRYSTGTSTKEVTIDYNQRWVKDHWGAFYSGYGKAPFFEYFSEEFHSLWDNKFKYLVDLNLQFFGLIIKLLRLDLSVKMTETYEQDYENDYRNVISPKKPFSDRKIYDGEPYTQVFSNTFVPNLSIVDLIMSEGPNAAQILTNSGKCE